MSTMRNAGAPLRILICALGGEGGGVLMNWIVAAARAAGYGVQATSVPGVAQRTGSTSYYAAMADERHAALDAFLAGEDTPSDAPSHGPDGGADGVPVPFRMPERKPKGGLANAH